MKAPATFLEVLSHDFLLYLTGQGKLQEQAKFKGRGTGLHILIRGMAESVQPSVIDHKWLLGKDHKLTQILPLSDGNWISLT